LKMHAILMLNAFTCRTIGWFLGTVFKDKLLNCVIGNIFAQMCMLTNGFFTSLEDWLYWITWFSVPRYTFRALLKLEFKWTDTFKVHPFHGIPSLGYPTKYIPAELTTTFQTLHLRDMNIMKSPQEPSILLEVALLSAISAVLLLFFALSLVWRIRKLEDALPVELPIDVPYQPWEENGMVDFCMTGSVSDQNSLVDQKPSLAKLRRDLAAEEAAAKAARLDAQQVEARRRDAALRLQEELKGMERVRSQARAVRSDGNSDNFHDRNYVDDLVAVVDTTTVNPRRWRELIVAELQPEEPPEQPELSEELEDPSESIYAI